MLFGVNPATIWLIPMLGEKHPNDYPRFRDCYLDEDDKIAVYTRVGGGNRNSGCGEEELYKHPNFLTTEDDDFDFTYATYWFSVPQEWKSDFEKIKCANMRQTSGAYKDRVYKVFPKLKGMLDGIFGNPIWAKDVHKGVS
jgi:hypothetical protein